MKNSNQLILKVQSIKLSLSSIIAVFGMDSKMALDAIFHFMKSTAEYVPNLSYSQAKRFYITPMSKGNGLVGWHEFYGKLSQDMVSFHGGSGCGCVEPSIERLDNQYFHNRENRTVLGKEYTSNKNNFSTGLMDKITHNAKTLNHRRYSETKIYLVSQIVAAAAAEGYVFTIEGGKISGEGTAALSINETINNRQAAVWTEYPITKTMFKGYSGDGHLPNFMSEFWSIQKNSGNAVYRWTAAQHASYGGQEEGGWSDEQFIGTCPVRIDNSKFQADADDEWYFYTRSLVPPLSRATTHFC